MDTFIPDAKFKPDAPTATDAGFIPDEHFVSDEERFGGLAGGVGAAALGAADMMSFGAASQALTRNRLVKPETLKGLAEANPVATGFGEAAGLAAAHFYGVGEAEDAIAASRLALRAARATGNAAEIAKATEAYSAVRNTVSAGDILNPVKAVSKAGSAASEVVGGGVTGAVAAGATEGALFGVEQTAHEDALGDSDDVAESLMHNVGYGALIGGGLGGALGVTSKAVSKIPDALGAVSKTVKKASSAVDQILADTPRKDIPILDPDLPKTGVHPTSIEEMQRRNAGAVADGKVTALPQQAAFDDAASRIAMDTPFNPLQRDSLETQAKRDNYNIIKELPGEHRDLFSETERRQKAELVDKTDQAIRDLSPNIEPTPHAVEGGQRAAEAFTEEIQRIREEIGPKIGALKQAEINVDHLPGVIDHLTNPEVSKYANPKLAALFDTTGSEIKLKPWNSGTGIEKKTYQNLKDMLEAFKDEETSKNFGRLFNIRDTLGSGVNLMESGKASSQLTQAKAAMMDYIQSMAEKASPDANVRDWFKKYAINEENAKIIEKKFGAEIGDDNFRSIAKNKPQENILDNIFRDSESVKAAKKILSPEKFNELLANHLAEQRAIATKDGAFSSNKFYSKNIAGNKYALEEAFADNTYTLQKLKDLNTLMRVLPDSPSVNPSGTAKTLIGALSLNPLELANGLKEYGLERFQKQQVIDEVNQKLSGRADQVEKLDRLAMIRKRVTNQIDTGVKNIFDAGKAAVGPVSQKLTPDERKEDFKKFSEKVATLNNNPQMMMKRITASTDELYPVAPKMTASIQSLAVRTTQFLASKLPPVSNPGPLSDPIEPSLAEIAKFDRYRQAVENPVGVLDQVKLGTLTNEALESLNIVHPKLYAQMKQSMFAKMAGLKNRGAVPYQTKIAVSRFMGEPLAESLKPDSVMASQAVYSQPTGQQQADQKMLKPSKAGMSKLTVASRTSLHSNSDS